MCVNKQLTSDVMGKFLCSQQPSVVCKTMLEMVLALKEIIIKSPFSPFMENSNQSNVVDGIQI